MHKTGTSSLQLMLCQFKARLLSHGIYYSSGNTPHALASLLLNAKQPQWNAGGIQSALEDAERAGAKVAIFSNEVVSILSENQLGRLVSAFKGHELIFVLCLRNLASFLPSRWSQNCIRRDSQSLKAYIEQLCNGYSEHPDIDHPGIVERFMATGSHDIRLVSYDNALLVDDSVLRTLFKALEIPSECWVTGEQHLHVNKRLSPLDIELCRLLNGVLAERSRRPQDDLFKSVAEHRVCDAFFDIHERLLHIPDSLLIQYRTTLRATMETVDLLPVVTNHARQHDLQKLKYLFLNPGTSSFTQTTNEAYDLECSSIHWQDFYDSHKTSMNHLMAQWGF